MHDAQRGRCPIKPCKRRLCQGLSIICFIGIGTTLAQQGNSEDESRPPTVRCLATPLTIAPDSSAEITARAMSPQHRPLTYEFSASSGKIESDASSAVFTAFRVSPGPVTVTCTVTDDHGLRASDTVRLNVTRGD